MCRSIISARHGQALLALKFFQKLNRLAAHFPVFGQNVAAPIGIKKLLRVTQSFTSPAALPATISRPAHHLGGKFFKLRSCTIATVRSANGFSLSRDRGCDLSH